MVKVPGARMVQSERFFHQSADLHFSKRQIRSARCWLTGVSFKGQTLPVTIFSLSAHHHCIPRYVNAGTILVAKKKQASCNKNNISFNLFPTW